MIIKNTGGEADKLLGAGSPACGVAELHESYMTEEGAMGMRPVQDGYIEIPSGGEVELKVGGLHIMCIDKLVEFEPGTRMSVTLQFEGSGKIDVEVEIQEP